MTKAELVDKIYAQNFDLNKREAEEIINELFAALRDEVAKSGRFSFPGFGTFTVRSRKARTGRNPQTGAEIKIPASKSVGFKPAPKFKESLNG